MTKLYSLILIGLIAVSCGPKPNSKNTEEVIEKPTAVPGQEEEVSRSILDPLFSFGSEEMLALAFGKENLKQNIAHGPEGTSTYPTTSVLQQTGEVTFNWAPEDTISGVYEHLNSISTESPEWETQEGIYVGMSLDELQTLNGEPFSLYGFEWEYGGLCWFEKGALQERSPRLGIKLEAAPSKIQSDDYRSSVGKSVFQSSDEQIKALDLRVASIRILAPKTSALTD